MPASDYMRSSVGSPVWAGGAPNQLKNYGGVAYFDGGSVMNPQSGINQPMPFRGIGGGASLGPRPQMQPPTGTPFGLQPPMYRAKGGAVTSPKSERLAVMRPQHRYYGGGVIGNRFNPQFVVTGGTGIGAAPAMPGRIGYRGTLSPAGRSVGIGSIQNLYAQKALDPNTGLPLNASDIDIANKRAELQRSGDFEALAAFDQYNSSKAAGNPQAIGDATQYIRSLRQRRVSDYAKQKALQGGNAANQAAQQASAPRNPSAPQSTDMYGYQNAGTEDEQPEGMAKGGPVKIQPYIVNEKGEEAYKPEGEEPQLIAGGEQMFLPPKDGKIIPHEKTMDMLSKGEIKNIRMMKPLHAQTGRPVREFAKNVRGKINQAGSVAGDVAGAVLTAPEEFAKGFAGWQDPDELRAQFAAERNSAAQRAEWLKNHRHNVEVNRRKLAEINNVLNTGIDPLTGEPLTPEMEADYKEKLARYSDFQKEDQQGVVDNSDIFSISEGPEYPSMREWNPYDNALLYGGVGKENVPVSIPSFAELRRMYQPAVDQMATTAKKAFDDGLTPEQRLIGVGNRMAAQGITQEGPTLRQFSDGSATVTADGKSSFAKGFTPEAGSRLVFDKNGKMVGYSGNAPKMQALPAVETPPGSQPEEGDKPASDTIPALPSPEAIADASNESFVRDQRVNRKLRDIENAEKEKAQLAAVDAAVAKKIADRDAWIKANVRTATLAPNAGASDYDKALVDSAKAANSPSTIDTHLSGEWAENNKRYADASNRVMTGAENQIARVGNFLAAQKQEDEDMAKMPEHLKPGTGFTQPSPTIEQIRLARTMPKLSAPFTLGAGQGSVVAPSGTIYPRDPYSSGEDASMVKAPSGTLYPRDPYASVEARAKGGPVKKYKKA